MLKNGVSNVKIDRSVSVFCSERWGEKRVFQVIEVIVPNLLRASQQCFTGGRAVTATRTTGILCIDSLLPHIRIPD